MRRAAKKDIMHYLFTDIIEMLRDGYKQPIDSEDVHQNAGFGDMLIGFGSTNEYPIHDKLKSTAMMNDGIGLMVEIKTGKNDTLTSVEVERQRRFRGASIITLDFGKIFMYLRILSRTDRQREWVEICRIVYEEEIEPRIYWNEKLNRWKIKSNKEMK